MDKDIVAVAMASGAIGIVVGIVATWVMVITSFGRTPIEDEQEEVNKPKCYKLDCIYHPDNEGIGYLRYREEKE